MSDSVRYFLESRVPELEDLFKKSLFSKEEIKDIVSKRTKFEHKIKRRGAILDDFLTYIQFEINLENTRKQRYELLKIRGKHTVSDHSIVKYILSLYRRAVTKFRGNMDLWNQYISFASDSKSDKAMPKIFATALQLHPESVDIWVQAANWEFKNQNNPASSRALFLRGIRMNSSSKYLWLEYFRMELEVANALFGTKIDSESVVQDALSVYDGAIAISVFKFATKECKLSAADSFEFYEMSLKFDNFKAVQKFIESFVLENMVDTSMFNVLRARSIASSLDFNGENFKFNLETCTKNLSDALICDISSSKILTEVVSILVLIFEKSEHFKNFQEIVYSKIDLIFKSIENLENFNLSHYISWSEISKKSDDISNYEEIIKRAQLKFPASLQVFELKSTLQTGTQVDFISVVSEYSSLIELSSSRDIDLDSLDHFFNNYLNIFDTKLIDLAKLVIKKNIPSTLSIEYLYKHTTLNELLAAIDLSKITSSLSKAIISFFISNNLLNDQTKKFVYKLCMTTSEIYTDIDSVISSIHFSLIINDISLCNIIHSKAMASLPRTEQFLIKFEELKETINIY